MHRGITAIRSTRVFYRGHFQPAVVILNNGRISAVLDYTSEETGELVGGELLDIGEQMLLPGLVDSHVHVNEPGRTDWEGFDTATHSAAAGGITTLVDMPLNCIPVTTSRTALQEKLTHLDDKLFIDCGFWGGATADNLDALPELLDAGVLGVKSFTIHSGIDDFKQVNESQLLDAMREVARKGLVHLVHAELDSGHSDCSEAGRSYQAFLASRPPQWETDAIAMVIRVMQQLTAEGLEPRAHIVHLSAASALPMIRAARAEGLQLTVETCPHYLTFAAEEIGDGATTFKCCPPIREQSNQQLLWDAIADGSIDCIVSDHSPCTPQLKAIDSGDLDAAWGGISGLQFGLSVLHHEAVDRSVAVEKVIELMTLAPARIAGLAGDRGSIEVGKRADFCVFDDHCGLHITADIIHHRHKVTPYAGRQLRGAVTATILAGNLIYDQGEFIGSASGSAILRR